MKDKRVLLILPAYREEKNIQSVLEGIKENTPEFDVLVIDDGSKDGTEEIAKNNGVQVIKHPFNMGYGVTVQTGYKYAVEHSYDIVIQLDSDGQHDPAYIRTLLEALETNKADVVIGSRFLEGGSYRVPLIRKLGIKFFSLIASTVTGQNITDSTSGFQALSRAVVEYYAALDNYPYDYPDADTIMTLIFAGFRICEVPVVMHERLSGRSMTSGLKSISYVFKMLISILIILCRKRLKVQRRTEV